jgi:hypothetical protein
LFIRGVEIGKHLFGGNYYVTITTSFHRTIHVEKLSERAAQQLSVQISSAINESLTLSEAYEEARKEG